MKLCFLYNDSELFNLIEKNTDITIKVLDQMDFNNRDIFIIRDKEISFNNLLSALDSDYFNITYILSGDYEFAEIKNIISIAKSKKIKVIPPNLTKNQIVNIIMKNINPKLFNMKKIIAFFGADSKVGTTMISQCIAEKLADNTSLKVALLFLNNSKGTDYIDEDYKSGLDEIRAKLSNGILSETDILGICYCPKENLYIIPGPESIFNLRFYYPEDIEILIEKISNMFDLLLIDAGSKFDSGLSIAALNSTVHKILISTQQNNAIKNFERYSNQLFDIMDINIKEFMLIINKYVNSNFLFSKSEMSNIYNMLSLGSLPHLGMTGWKAEMNNKSLNEYNNDLFDSNLQYICRIIANKINISFSLPNNKNSFFERFKKLKRHVK